MDQNYCRNNCSLKLVLIWMLVILVLGLFSDTLNAARIHKEAWYQKQWCTKGQMEYRLSDYTRIDCLTATHAVELDFAEHWYEGYTQALWYASNTGLRAGLVLIIEDPDIDLKYFERAKRLKAHYSHPIDIWTISE